MHRERSASTPPAESTWKLSVGLTFALELLQLIGQLVFHVLLAFFALIIFSFTVEVCKDSAATKAETSRTQPPEATTDAGSKESSHLARLSTTQSNVRAIADDEGDDDDPLQTAESSSSENTAEQPENDQDQEVQWTSDDNDANWLVEEPQQWKTSDGHVHVQYKSHNESSGASILSPEKRATSTKLQESRARSIKSQPRQRVSTSPELEYLDFQCGRSEVREIPVTPPSGSPFLQSKPQSTLELGLAPKLRPIAASPVRRPRTPLGLPISKPIPSTVPRKPRPGDLVLRLRPIKTIVKGTCDEDDLYDGPFRIITIALHPSQCEGHRRRHSVIPYSSNNNEFTPPVISPNNPMAKLDLPRDSLLYRSTNGGWVPMTDLIKFTGSEPGYEYIATEGLDNSKVVINGEEMWVCEKVRAKKFELKPRLGSAKKRTPKSAKKAASPIKYLVHWKGYPAEDDSWEPAGGLGGVPEPSIREWEQREKAWRQENL